MTGNLIHGRCAPGSDIDLKAITTGDFVGKKVTDDFKGYMVDCEHYPLDFLKSNIPREDINLIAKIKNSRFLMGDQQVAAEIKTLIQELPFEKMAFKSFRVGGGNLNEAQNEFDLGDYDASIILGREAITSLAQSLLLRYRDVQVRNKYILKGLRKICPEHQEFFQKYVAIQGLQKVILEKRQHAEHVLDETVSGYGYVQHVFEFWSWEDLSWDDFDFGI